MAYYGVSGNCSLVILAGASTSYSCPKDIETLREEMKKVGTCGGDWAHTCLATVSHGMGEKHLLKLGFKEVYRYRSAHGDAHILTLVWTDPKFVVPQPLTEQEITG